LLLFGTLSKEGKNLALDTFIFTAKGGEVRRMTRASFDTELLSAGVEFYRLAGELAAKGAKSGDPVKVPSNVLPNLGPSGVKVAEAKYGVQPGKESIDTGEPDQPAKDDGTRKPLGDGKRAPLKRK